MPQSSPSTNSTPWLDAFWTAESTGSAQIPAESEPAPKETFPMPEPGTVFLIVMAVGTALWQRLRHLRR